MRKIPDPKAAKIARDCKLGSAKTGKRTILDASIIIQKWWRRWRARMELKRRLAWRIYQKIEYTSDSKMLRMLHSAFTEMITLNKVKDRKEHRALAAKTPSKSFYERLRLFGDREDLDIASNYDSGAGFADVDVEESYTGPQLTFPLSANDVQKLLQAFKEGKQLHARYLLELLHETRLLLKTKPNINKASTSISKLITVVGDLHGSLRDLLNIFYKNGLPDVNNPYVFNGDYVDKGPQMIEILAVLCACLLAWPTAVYLNRGNHEDPKMNALCGFYLRVQQRYKVNSKRVINLLGDLFSWLPLATIIDNRILVVHGGISDKVDLEYIQKLDRHLIVSACEHAKKPEMAPDPDAIRQVVDLLWSDPRSTSGCAPNTERGLGCYFGEDVTEKFLKKFKLSLIVRSHEVPSEGYQYQHKRKVLTIFSVSNYNPACQNKGAYVTFDNGGVPKFVQYTSSDETVKSIQKEVSATAESALKALRMKIIANKLDLITAFQQYDPERSGHVYYATWCSIMKTKLQLDLPWHLICHRMMDLNDEGNVAYMDTFTQTGVKYRETVNTSVTEMLYKNNEELEAVFRVMDKDGDGFISYDEFKDTCRLVGWFVEGQNYTEDELSTMCGMVDLNADRKINYNEFLEAFRIVEYKPDEMGQRTDDI